MFEKLAEISRRPKPYEFYTAELLWNDKHISKKMLELHLDESVDLASRNKAFVDKSAKWIASRFDIGPGTKICDFGCGPGLYASRFAELGADVTGVDFSESSIEYARQTAAERQLPIDYVLGNYLEFSTTQKFDLITMIYCDFCPLSPQQRRVMLGKFREYLKIGGTVLLDVLSMNHFETTQESASYDYSPGGGFWSDAPYYQFVNTFKYKREELLLSKHTIVERERTREIFNWLQCFSLESLKAELEENGFRVVEHYCDVAGKPFEADSSQMAVVAKLNTG